MYKKSYKLDPACFWSLLLDFSVIQQKLNLRIWDSDSGLQWHLYPFADPIPFKYQTLAVFYTSTGIRIRRPLPPAWARYPSPHALLLLTGLGATVKHWSGLGVWLAYSLWHKPNTLQKSFLQDAGPLTRGVQESALWPPLGTNVI